MVDHDNTRCLGGSFGSVVDHGDTRCLSSLIGSVVDHVNASR